MDKVTEMNDIVLDDDNEGNIGIYKHTFKKPFNYNGDEIKELTFDFDKLTGNDGLAIDNELMSLGKVAPVPAMNSDYLIRLCARACTRQVSYDVFLPMGLQDYSRIISRARSFLLRAE